MNSEAMRLNRIAACLRELAEDKLSITKAILKIMEMVGFVKESDE